MHFQLHSLTAISLALLYSAVGLTGESLHYLVELSNREQQKTGQVASADDKPSVYLHRHGSDVHYHAHWVAKKPATESEASADEETASQHASLDAPFTHHEPHTCPLLTIVANLKLGIGGAYSIFIAPGADVSAVCEHATLFSQADIRQQLPRGPPA